MRHFVILATLTMTACALPGASSGNSFMAAMHPTQDFCASRGLTLDAKTKQCVTPPQSAPTEVTGSLPPQGTKKSPPQPQPQQEQQQPLPPSLTLHVQPPAPIQQRGALPVPVEPDAAIDPKLQQDADLTELAHFVRASGYRCDSVNALRPGSDRHRFKLACNRGVYKYGIEDKDGRWSVTVE